ncbi:peptidoglycan-binding domain-containing protein [Streptomyces olivoreticuli]
MSPVTDTSCLFPGSVTPGHPVKRRNTIKRFVVLLAMSAGLVTAGLLATPAVARSSTSPASAETAKCLPKEFYTGTELTIEGSDKKRVKEVQCLLKYHGFEEVAIDGFYGSKTRAAVKKFQKEHPPLKVDGEVGIKTWDELRKPKAKH